MDMNYTYHGNGDLIRHMKLCLKDKDFLNGNNPEYMDKLIKFVAYRKDVKNIEYDYEVPLIWRRYKYITLKLPTSELYMQFHTKNNKEIMTYIWKLIECYPYVVHERLIENEKDFYCDHSLFKIVPN